MKTLALILFASLLSAQSPARSPTILHPRQLPPVVQCAPFTMETPQPGTTANTWTLTKPVTGVIMIFWHGVFENIGGDFVFTGDGNGGTLLTLTPAAIALGFWADNLELVAVYQ